MDPKYLPSPCLPASAHTTKTMRMAAACHIKDNERNVQDAGVGGFPAQPDKKEIANSLTKSRFSGEHPVSYGDSLFDKTDGREVDAESLVKGIRT